MAVLDTVRALIQDTGVSPRFTNTELSAIMADAMQELNVWADTTWTVNDLDTVPCPVPLSHQQIFMMAVKLRVIDAILANTDKATKMITQDAQIDATSSTSRLNRTKMLLEQELDKKLTFWLGIKRGGVLRHTGQQWGGS